MKQIVLLVAIASITFYVVQYNEHQLNTCNDTACLAIYCPPGGCIVAEEKIICADKECVEKVLKKHGTEHLVGVWRVEWFDDSSPITQKMEVKKSYKVE